MGFFSFIPYYATVQYGMGPLESGAILTPRSLVMIPVSMTTSFLLARVGYRLPMLVGICCVAGTLTILGLDLGDLQVGPIHLAAIVPLLTAMALSGLGMGLLIPASNNAGLDLLPKRAAIIAGLRGLFNSTGGVVGTAIIVVWLSVNTDKAAGMRSVFTVLSFLMLLTLPLVFLIPDRARERITADARAEAERTEAAVAAARAAAREPGAARTPAGAAAGATAASVAATAVAEDEEEDVSHEALGFFE
jgi:MFS family permease